MASASTNPPTKHELNILLMGETGVGKSTWLNGFSTFLKFASFDDAESRMQGEIFPIPVSLTVADPETLKVSTVFSHNDENEDHEKCGRSVTQMPTTYEFWENDLCVHIIDTPGVGDTRGEEQDKKNIDYIIYCLKSFDRLHAICILLKSEQARLTPGFKYCLVNILQNLHENACHNVIFCFTSSMQSDFKPGKTLQILREFIADEHLSLSTEKDHIFCVDNAAIECLTKVKNRLSVEDREKRRARDCWNESATSVKRMLQRIREMKPFPVSSTLSINDAKDKIQTVRRLAIAIVRSIDEDQKEAKQKEAEIEKTKSAIRADPLKHGRNIRDQLFTTVTKANVVKLNYSITVCKSLKCSKVVNGHVCYPVICDDFCAFAISLYWCEAFDGSGQCTKCGCHYSEHKWETSRMEITHEKELLTNAADVVLSQDECLKALEDTTKKLKERLDCLTKEKSHLILTCAKMSVYAETSSLLKSGFVDEFKVELAKELDVLIKKSASGDHAARENKTMLETVLQEYDRCRNQEKGTRFTPANVDRMMSELYGLRLKGADLRKAVEADEEAKKQAMKPTRFRKFISSGMKFLNL
jgi:GTPase SAR1 family protein